MAQRILGFNVFVVIVVANVVLSNHRPADQSEIEKRSARQHQVNEAAAEFCTP